MIDKLSLSARAERRALGYRPGRYRMPSRPRRTGSPALWHAIVADRQTAYVDRHGAIIDEAAVAIRAGKIGVAARAVA